MKKPCLSPKRPFPAALGLSRGGSVPGGSFPGGLFLLSLLLSGCARQPGPVAPHPADGSRAVSQPPEVSGGQEVTFAGYGITAPTGMILTQTSRGTAKATHVTYRWRGPIRPDKTRTVLVWETVQAVPGMETDPTPAIIARDSQDNAGRHASYVASRIVPYTVHGLPFFHYYWKGFFSATKSENRGFVYVTSGPQTIIYIRATDSDPYNKATLALCEKAALSFRKL